MNILHICNDFCGSKVHANLYKRLDELGVNQTIFTYYRGKNTDGRNQFDSHHTLFIYKNILRIWHRAFYHLKIHRVYSELLREIKPLDYDLTHATTLFSDGAIAYKLFKDYGIPYIVAVRSTDVNEFLKLAPHTWGMGFKVLKNAQRIIFITPIIKEKLCRHIIVSRISSELSDKYILLPNGIDDYWLKHINNDLPVLSKSVVYVGTFLKRKNVEKLISAVLNLQKKYPDLILHIVGDKGCRKKQVLALIHQYPEQLVYHGQITDKSQLKELYRQCSIFAMPSYNETFGLVYIEALTQNMALLYSKRQGIDGLFDNYIGESINPRSIESIEQGLDTLLQNRVNYSNHSVDFTTFDWNVIAQQYLKVYKCILE